MKSIRKGLFLYLIIAFLIAVGCSASVNILANSIQNKIWIKYIDDISEYYKMYNEYSKQFGDVISIPKTEIKNLNTTDAIIIEICDFFITWGGLIFTFILMFFTVTLFYKKRLKTPLDLLEKSADRISNQNLDFNIDYKINDEMGYLCITFL